MGAKTASKPRLRSIAYKCDLCGRKFTRLDALKSHQRTLHNLQPKKSKPKPLEGKSKAKLEKKGKVVKRQTQPCPSPQISSNKQNFDSKSDSEVWNQKEVVEFECPKCFRIFMTYFLALKHIQKFHCVNRQGGKVPPNSPYLIQPIRIELCLKCNRKVKSIPNHICDSMIKNIKESLSYTCTACGETFVSLRAFDIHVVSFHSSEVESLFFPNNVVFTRWKLDMENQTKVKYAIIDRYDSKCYYHCSYESAQVNDKANLCPSTIIVQELSKGIQVHLYKLHYKHSFVAYKLSNKYKKYLLNSFLKDLDGITNMNDMKCDDIDMYGHFKTLMESIVHDASNTDLCTLKILLGKALDMTSVLTNYEEKMEGEDLCQGNKSMNETQIENALMEKRLSAKRKSLPDLHMHQIKRARSDQIITTSDTTSPKIINCYSLAMNEKSLEDVNVIVENPDTPKVENFICDVTADKSEANIDENDVKQNGNDESDKKYDISDIENNKSEIGNHDGTNESNNSVVGESNMSPVIDKKLPQKFDTFSSFDESYADFLSKNFNANENTPKNKKIGAIGDKNTPNSTNKKNKIQKKPIVKTKIGQFKGVSPKKPKPTLKKAIRFNSDKPRHTMKKPTRVSFHKPKVDFKYEVKEQEDDCNILILKL